MKKQKRNDMTTLRLTTIKIGKFAKGFKQKKMIETKYSNELATVYSVKIGFRRFLCLTIWN